MNESDENERKTGAECLRLNAINSHEHYRSFKQALVIHFMWLLPSIRVSVSVIFTTLYSHRAGARVRNEDGFYSVKVEWLARRRWHMATKITTLSRLTTYTHTYPLADVFSTANSNFSLSPSGISRWLHEYCFVIVIIRENNNSRASTQLNIFRRKSLRNFPFLDLIMLSLFIYFFPFFNIALEHEKLWKGKSFHVSVFEALQNSFNLRYESSRYFIAVFFFFVSMCFRESYDNESMNSSKCLRKEKASI